MSDPSEAWGKIVRTWWEEFSLSAKTMVRTIMVNYMFFKMESAFENLH